MSAPSRTQLASWLMAIGKPPMWDMERTHRSKTDWRYETLCWIEGEMVKYGIVRRISETRYHKRALAYFDYLKYLENKR